MRKLSVCVAFYLFSVGAYGDVVLYTGNQPQANEENVVFTEGDSGTVVTGITQDTGLALDITSTGTLIVSANSTIVGDNQPITHIDVALETGAFTDVILNLGINFTTCTGCAGHSVTVGVDLLNEPSVSLGSFSLGNGQNFFTLVAMSGEAITGVTFDAPNGFSDISATRLSGPYPGSSVPVPEPATLALVGLGLAGAAFARRRPSI